MISHGLSDLNACRISGIRAIVVATWSACFPICSSIICCNMSRKVAPSKEMTTKSITKTKRISFVCKENGRLIIVFTQLTQSKGFILKCSIFFLQHDVTCVNIPSIHDTQRLKKKIKPFRTKAGPRAGVSERLNESDWELVGYPLPRPTKITPSFGEKQGEGIAIKFSVPRAAPAPPRPAIAP